MNIDKTGGPAFPLYCGHGDEHNAEGMTLRDFFAAKAMQAIVQITDIGDLEGRLESGMSMIAAIAYVTADAMLKEREK